jgi:hypothetical protein
MIKKHLCKYIPKFFETNFLDFCRTIMVVGAGRGPLVNRALEAADRAKYKVHIYAIEKNPMAIIS